MPKPKRFPETFAFASDGKDGRDISLAEVISTFLSDLIASGAVKPDLEVTEVFINHPTDPTRILVEFNDKTRAEIEMLAPTTPLVTLTLTKASIDILRNCDVLKVPVPRQTGPDSFAVDVDRETAYRLASISSDMDTAIRILSTPKH